MICCICGDDEYVKWCKWCRHSFCPSCRQRYFHRGKAAIREWLTASPPNYCDH